MANRNYGAQDPRNSFTNPVGSSSSFYEVKGTGGSTRHAGYFSPNNPYYAQLQVADNNQDMDALYELAVQWEADYANRQMQLDENREILEEQRLYDSPAEQIRRAREAGINPDISGSSGSGSGSGSSAQLANPGMADQSGQSKFSNKYDNTALVFEGLNSASNMAGTLMSGVSGIMNAVSNMKILPSEIALNEAQAGLQDAQANEVRSLLGGKVEGQQLSNAFQGIQNSTAILQQLAQFSDLIAPDTEDMTPYLTALGVPEANIPAYSGLIKQMHANPQMRDKYAKAEVSAKFSEAENAEYTQETVANMVELDRKIKYEKQALEFHSTHLQGQIASLLDTDEYASDVAGLEMLETEVSSEQLGVTQEELKLKAQQIQYNTEIFLQSLVDKASAIKANDAVIADIKKLAQGRSLTKNEIAQINRLTAENISLRTMFSDEFYKIKTSYLTAAQTLYNRYHYLDANGNVTKNISSLEPGNLFSDATFNDLIYHVKTPGEVAREWTNTTISAAGVAVDAVGVARGFNFNQTYRDVHNGRSYRAGYEAGRFNQ